MNPNGIKRRAQPREVGQDGGHPTGGQRLGRLWEGFAKQIYVQFPVVFRRQPPEPTLEKSVPSLGDQGQFLEQRRLANLFVPGTKLVGNEQAVAERANRSARQRAAIYQVGAEQSKINDMIQQRIVDRDVLQILDL